METYRAIQIHPSDNVAVAPRTLPAGVEFTAGERTLVSREKIPGGHKIALTDIPEGKAVVKYGAPIAIAREEIPAGSWVHTHNARTGLSETDTFRYEHRVFPLPEYSPPERAQKTFQGYLRDDGRAGVRNEIWILPVVGCVNGTAQLLADRHQDLVSGSIDGLYAFPHPFGCSQLGDDLRQTGKLLAALAHHPNAGGVLCLGLGCENLTREMFLEAVGDYDPKRVRFLTCQETDDELEAGAMLLRELADYAGSAGRQTVPASELVIGMKCGGSDGFSGITANPAVGGFSDRLTALGGTTILTEVPEMFGAENILFSRCASQEVFDRAVRMVEDFRRYYAGHGQPVYENPSPGNKKGGITTLEDKSCGCIQKGGHAQIVDVLSYADRVTRKGLNLLSGPGNDLISATDLTAAGAQIILFTTGRGTPFGAPAPTVKISSNTDLFRRKRGWIDFNAGTIAEGMESVDEVSDRLLDYVLRVASGERTCSEVHGFREIAIFKDGVVL